MLDQLVHISPEDYDAEPNFNHSHATSPKLKVRVLRYILSKTLLVVLVSFILVVTLFQVFSLTTVKGDVSTQPDNMTVGVDKIGSALAAAASPIVIGAGDISTCANDNDLKTAQLIQAVFATGVAGKVIGLGDNVYESGTATEFTKCYHPSWGRFTSRIAPAVGNHEYLTTGATGYFNYFGTRAGDPKKGYYSYNLGTWHIVVINSNCSKVGGCQVGSPQERWLRADLAANPRACTLAYWHHPLFSSGSHGNNVAVKPIWNALYDFNADVVLSGHDHLYERFGPQNSAGVLDGPRGIREFVVGTGGKNLTGFSAVKPNSITRNATTFGVLKLTLNASSFSWQFIPIAGQTFKDSGTILCH